MNRILKFRAWIDADKKMYDVIQLQSKFSDEDFYRVFINKERIEGQPMNYRMTGRNSIMQFTGLLDKNGKEIYEWDIVKWGHLPDSQEDEIRIATVEINPDIQFNCQNIKYPHVFRYGNFAYPSNQIEVIGNIFENPDLIHK